MTLISPSPGGDEPFKKYDQLKPCFSLVAQFAKQLGEVNQTMEHGAKKYGRDNWKLARNSDVDRYLDACLRHAFALRSGEEIDPESGLPHAAHIITNLLFYRYLKDAKPKEMYGETNEIRVKPPKGTM